LILIALLWVLTQPLQTHYLLRTVNRTLINSGHPHRVSESLAQNKGNPYLLGYWYSMISTEDRMFVFALPRDGILVPLGAIVSSEGDVKEMIPLSAHAAQVIDEIPASVQRMYAARIEAAAKTNGGMKTR
jgi:hypothetical protein